MDFTVVSCSSLLYVTLLRTIVDPAVDLFLDIMGKTKQDVAYLSNMIYSLGIFRRFAVKSAYSTRLIAREEGGLLSPALFFHLSWLL